MEWDKYYQETEVLPFNAQAPYYAYLLEQLSVYMTRGKEAGKPITVALGGLHPQVTTPTDFISLCQKALAVPLNTYIIDQNKQALLSFAGAPDQTLLCAQLESLPESVPPLSLLICDFTLDFMSDSQIKALNQTLPSKIDQRGIFMVFQDNPPIPLFSKIQSKYKYGIPVYPRSVKSLCKLLSNLKPIYQATTESNSNLTVFTPKTSPIPSHEGQPFILGSSTGQFADWLTTYHQK